MKKTLVLGASTNQRRYSYIATVKLLNAGHEVIPVGVKKGNINNIPIQNDRPVISGLDTVTLYLNPTRQKEYYEYIIELNPKRIIFNPGTENMVLAKLARESGIEVQHACTLVLLSLDQY